MKTLVFILVSIFSTQSFAVTHEIKSFKELSQYVKPSTLWVFDNDNTLTKSTQILGSDQGFRYQIDLGKQQGLGDDQADDAALKIWNKVEEITSVLPIEPDTSYQVGKIQDSGPVMVETARGIELKEATEKQLASVGLNFKKSPPYPSPLKLKAGHYSDGILYVSSKFGKGEALVEFLKKSGLFGKIKNIVMVDDRKENTDSIEEAFSGSKFNVDTLRYGAEDKNVAKFSQQKTLYDVELSVFLSSGKLISDTDAVVALKSSKRK